MVEPLAEDWLVVGRITGCYGIRGWVKIHSYTDPQENFLGFGQWMLRRRDGVEPERPQRLPLVAPRIQVPVVAVVHEPLRRDLAVDDFAVLATLVTQTEALACEHCRGDRPEVSGRHAS